MIPLVIRYFYVVELQKKNELTAVATYLRLLSTDRVKASVIFINFLLVSLAFGAGKWSKFYGSFFLRKRSRQLASKQKTTRRIIGSAAAPTNSWCLYAPTANSQCYYDVVVVVADTGILLPWF